LVEATIESRKPAYLLIPDLIEEDLATGRLKPRDRLPGLRDLAGALNLNYTTVARAMRSSPTRLARYAGRQRNVRARPDTDVPAIRREQRRDDDEHAPEPTEMVDRLQRSAAALFAVADPYQLMRYQDFGGTPADRAAGRAWLANRLPGCSSDNVLVCPESTTPSSRSSPGSRAAASDLPRFARVPRHQGNRIAIGRAVAAAATTTTDRSRTPSSRSAEADNPRRCTATPHCRIRAR
jgi:hypothetical protein